MDAPRTDTRTLIKALYILARDIESGDGVANAAIAEGARRIEELEERNISLRLGIAKILDSVRTLAADSWSPTD